MRSHRRGYLCPLLVRASASTGAVTGVTTEAAAALTHEYHPQSVSRPRRHRGLLRPTEHTFSLSRPLGKASAAWTAQRPSWGGRRAGGGAGKPQTQLRIATSYSARASRVLW